MTDLEKTWVPDGRGLPEIARKQIARDGQRVHLRLTAPGGRSAVSACGWGLGEWWTGKGSEVTCSACLQVVHA